MSLPINVGFTTQQIQNFNAIAGTYCKTLYFKDGLTGSNALKFGDKISFLDATPQNCPALLAVEGNLTAQLYQSLIDTSIPNLSAINVTINGGITLETPVGTQSPNLNIFTSRYAYGNFRIGSGASLELSSNADSANSYDVAFDKNFPNPSATVSWFARFRSPVISNDSNLGANYGDIRCAMSLSNVLPASGTISGYNGCVEISLEIKPIGI